MQSQEDAYAAMAMKDTLSSPFGLDSARPTLGLSDVRAQPTKKDYGCATLETEGTCLMLLPSFRHSCHTET